SYRRSSVLPSEDGYVTCPQCHKPITSYNLNRHIKMVHMTMDRAQCSLCHKMFKNKYSLSTHMHRQHHEFVQQHNNFSLRNIF
ncbi:Zinc finger C2H2-type, partial [Trinorchestia longiramus]